MSIKRTKEKHTYFISKPHKTRPSFVILRRNRTTHKSEKIFDVRIDAINKAFKVNKNFDDAFIKLEEIKQEYQNSEQDTFLYAPDNQKLLREYWDDVYDQRHHKDKESARYRLNRAIKELGQLSLHTATKKELQAIVNQAAQPRETAAVLQQFLKFIGRPEKLTPPPKPKTKIDFINKRELDLLAASFLDKDERSLIVTLFATGLRLGEGFGLSEDKVHANNTVFISEQMRENGKFDDTKTRRSRKVPIITEYAEQVRHWAMVANKEELRKQEWSKILAKKSKEIIGKRITPHDLRHSYAIHLLSKGVSLSLVAQALGNSVTVCQTYYAGFDLSDEGIKAILEKI